MLLKIIIQEWIVSLFKLDAGIYATILICVLIFLRPVLWKQNELTGFEDKVIATNEAGIKKGVDVSFYQGVINWPNVLEHVDFVFLKSTDGITYQDPRFIENAKALQHSDKPFGAYHFYEPEDDPIKQADNFLNTVKAYSVSLRPVLDVEINRHLPPSKIAKGVKAWLEYVEQHLGCAPIIYTYASFWDENLGKQFNSYDFWLADYTPKPVLPRSRTDYQIWQYSQSGRMPGIKGAVDLDSFSGDEAQFESLKCKSTKKL